jgi:hypothetical protein
MDPEAAVMAGFAATTGLPVVLGLIDIRMGGVSSCIFAAVGAEIAQTAGFLAAFRRCCIGASG